MCRVARARVRAGVRAGGCAGRRAPTPEPPPPPPPRALSQSAVVGVSLVVAARARQPVRQSLSACRPRRRVSSAVVGSRRRVAAIVAPLTDATCADLRHRPPLTDTESAPRSGGACRSRRRAVRRLVASGARDARRVGEGAWPVKWRARRAPQRRRAEYYFAPYSAAQINDHEFVFYELRQPAGLRVREVRRLPQQQLPAERRTRRRVSLPAALLRLRGRRRGPAARSALLAAARRLPARRQLRLQRHGAGAAARTLHRADGRTRRRRRRRRYRHLPRVRLPPGPAPPAATCPRVAPARVTRGRQRDDAWPVVVRTAAAAAAAAAAATAADPRADDDGGRWGGGHGGRWGCRHGGGGYGEAGDIPVDEASAPRQR